MPHGVTTPAAILGRIVRGKSPGEPLCWSEYLQIDGDTLVWTKDQRVELTQFTHVAAEKRAKELSAREGCHIFPLIVEKPIPHKPIPDPLPHEFKMDPRRAAQCRRDPVEAD